MESDLARRAASTFAPFSSAFRPVNKISDILQLSQAKHLDSGEICEVSTTAVDRDEDNASKENFENYLKCCIWILAFSTNFCPIKTDLSGNTVWPQASGFQKLA